MLFVAGCGADDDATTSSPPSTDVTEEPTMPPAPSETTPGDDDTPPPETTPPEATPPETTAPETTPPRRTPPPRLTPSPDPDTSTPVAGEVPAEYLDPVIADAAGRAGAAPGDVRVTRAQAKQWSDGSLGCPQPGQMYTQALVDGYWVELDVGGQPFDYRLNERGTFRLCTSPSLQPPNRKR